MSDLEQRFLAAIDAHRRGELDRAEPVYREVLAADPKNAEAHHMMGIAYYQRQNLSEAEASLCRALELEATTAKYHNTLGSILNAQARRMEALAAFDAAIACEPGFVTAIHNKAVTLIELGNAREAERVCRAALNAGLYSADIYDKLTTAQIQQNKIADAITAGREGLSRYPDDQELRLNLASALELSNDLGEAETEARRVFEYQSPLPMSRLILARVMRRTRNAEGALAVLTPLLGLELSLVDRIEVLYEQGFILEALGSYPEAFAAFTECNALQRELPDAAKCDADRFLHSVRTWRAWLGLRQETRPSPVEKDTPPPVFFVGFPRSGTTLVEQVLMTHPDIVTTEENSPLGPVRRLANEMAQAQGQPFPAWLDTASQDDLDLLRQEFDAQAADLFGGKTGLTLVDKLPLNIVPLGLVEKLWPDAKVLVALRDPRDACLSCFMQKFTLNDAMANYLDIGSTGTAYAEVMGLWLAYREALSLPYLEYRYEDLVGDFELTIREILDFIGVGWHDDVSKYREAAKKRDIKTPSYREVTGEVHRRAVARWKRYENQLSPILPTLAPYVRAFGYEE